MLAHPVMLNLPAKKVRFPNRFMGGTTNLFNKESVRIHLDENRHLTEDFYFFSIVIFFIRLLKI